MNLIKKIIIKEKILSENRSENSVNRQTERCRGLEWFQQNDETLDIVFSTASLN